MSGGKKKHAKQVPRHCYVLCPSIVTLDGDDDGSDEDDDKSGEPDLQPKEESPPVRRYPQRAPMLSMRLTRTSTETTQVPLRTPPYPNPKTVEEAEEDKLWREAMTRFPFSSLPNLPSHPGRGPGPYVLDQNNRVFNPETATAALEVLFCNITEGTNALQLKAEEAFGTIIARKMVDN